MIDTVNDAIRPKDDLADVREAVFRHDATALWLRLQYFRVCDEPKSECLGTLWAVAGDETNDVVEVVA
jgi:hypothetical protein